MGNADTELKALVHAAALERFKLEYADKFQAMKAKHPNDKRLIAQCNSWMALVYEENGFADKALAILEQLITDSNLPFELRPPTLSRLVQMLTERNRKDEAKMYFDKHLYSVSSAASVQLFLLDWFVQNFNPTHDALLPYKPLFDSLCDTVKYYSTKTELKDRIRETYQAEHNTNVRFSRTLMKTKDKSEQEKMQAWQEFLATQPHGIYRQMGEENIKKLLS